MRVFHAKVKHKHKNRKALFTGIILISGGIALGYVFLWPHHTGAAGAWVNRIISFLFGYGKYLVPILCVVLGGSLFSRSRQRWRVTALGLTILLWASSVFFSLITPNTPERNLGGFIGKYSEKFMVQALDYILSFIVLACIVVAVLHWIMNISIVHFIAKLFERIRDDWKEFQRIRIEDKKKKKEPFHEPPVIRAFEEPVIPEKPTIVTVKPAAPLMEDIHSKSKQLPLKQNKVIPSASSWKLPPIDFLDQIIPHQDIHKEDELVSRAAQLENALSSFNIQTKVTDINPGPIITRYDLKLGPGIKVGSIISLSNDLALAMKSSSIRIVAPIPGKAAVGIEIPNTNTAVVGLREIISSDQFTSIKSKLAIGLGKTTEGRVFCADLLPMPHVLIAGATGSGKSVCIHSMITSILYKALPDEVKLILIDPKRLELPIYNGLPHLYDPNAADEQVEVITNSKQAAKTLEQLTKVMERRYERFAKVSVRNIDGYNQLMAKKGEPKEFFIVVIIDELADLMLIASRDVEESIQRLAQMARAVGIHLVLATQRPSVDVITGVIKANLSTRIAFQVLSKVDSRVILDTQGAEDLMGRGDMLFLASGEPKPFRLQGAYVSEKEVERIVSFYKAQGTPAYNNELLQDASFTSPFENEESFNDLITALQLIKERKRISQDLLKAHFGSSARATNILSLLEIKHFIRKPEGSNRWEIFFDQVDSFLEEHKGSIQTSL